MTEYEKNMADFIRLARWARDHLDEIEERGDALIMGLDYEHKLTLSGAGSVTRALALLYTMADKMTAAIDKAEAQDIQEGRNGYQ